MKEPSPQMFRQHDDPATGVVPELYRQLTQEWANLHSLSSTAAAVRRWGRREPLLAQFSRPGDVVDAIDNAPAERKDELLLALIRLFHDGHQLAGRTVLQALLPKLARMTYSVDRATCRVDTMEDRRHVVVSEFWDVLATYPAGRRTSSVAGGLALDTLHRITGVRQPPTAEIPIDPDTLASVLLHHQREDTAAAEWDVFPDLTADASLEEVIGWAGDAGVLSSDDALLLSLSTRRPHEADSVSQSQPSG